MDGGGSRWSASEPGNALTTFTWGRQRLPDGEDVMGTVSYAVVDGEIISEDRDGAFRQYVPDPLGSTVALLDQNQAVTDTFSYWPYGEARSHSGTAAPA